MLTVAIAQRAVPQLRLFVGFVSTGWWVWVHGTIACADTLAWNATFARIQFALERNRWERHRMRSGRRLQVGQGISVERLKCFWFAQDCLFQIQEILSRTIETKRFLSQFLRFFVCGAFLWRLLRWAAPAMIELNRHQINANLMRKTIKKINWSIKLSDVEVDAVMLNEWETQSLVNVNIHYTDWLLTYEPWTEHEILPRIVVQFYSMIIKWIQFEAHAKLFLNGALANFVYAFSINKMHLLKYASNSIYHIIF